MSLRASVTVFPVIAYKLFDLAGRLLASTATCAGSPLQKTIDARTAYTEPIGNRRGPAPLLVQPSDLLGLDLRPAALVHATRYGDLDAVHLPLPPQVVLELSEDTEHRQEGFAGGRAGVDGVLRHLRSTPFSCRH
jgi:hypothetical protein